MNETLNIHEIVINVTLMRLASAVTISRTFVNEPINAVIEEINLHMENADLPYRIEQVKTGKVPYLNLEHERLDRVLYFLSLIIRKPKKLLKGVN